MIEIINLGLEIDPSNATLSSLLASQSDKQNGKLANEKPARGTIGRKQAPSTSSSSSQRRSKSSLSSGCDDNCGCGGFEPVQMKEFEFCGSCGDNNVGIVSLTKNDEYSHVEKKCLRILRTFIESIIKGNINLPALAQEMSVKGIFIKLCDPKQFADLVFPGTPNHILKNLPKNMKDLLLCKDINLDLIAVCKKAVDVLNGAKRRGQSEGEEMDDCLEDAILPHIIYESLALEIVNLVRILGRKLNSIRAQVSIDEASPTSEKASFDQLDGDVINTISTGVSIQPEYMGSEWATQILLDVKRFIQMEKMSEKMMTYSNDEANLAPMTSFIDYDDVLDKYPAMVELIQQLHALPYEINGKLSQGIVMPSPGRSLGRPHHNIRQELLLIC